MNALKKQRDKHSSRSADFAAAVAVLVVGNRLASATPANTPSEKMPTLKRNTGILARNSAFLRGHESASALA